MWETWVLSLSWEDPLEKAMATHSSTLAWKIPWTEEPGRLQSTGSQRVGHNWATSLLKALLPSSKAARKSNSQIFKVYNETSKPQPRAWSTTSLAPINELSLCPVLLTAAFFRSDFPHSGQHYPFRFREGPWRLDLWQADYKAGLSRHCISEALSAAKVVAAAGSNNCSFAALTFSTGRHLSSSATVMSLFFNYRVLAGEGVPGGTEYSCV